ncbi:MAG TPA: AAA family ATPase [Ornithinimicrobium sp.]|uniref:HelD family protein n=1 Tax=Ornithinimicrobium sp. TaxID=1977084 RepID=UPI002B4716BB|nr:AAA family ATPase [Ornithinimicrobium sp.]HKJ12345.1 AAA family ATPase [Ornithinimicrobium sp.]
MSAEVQDLVGSEIALEQQYVDMVYRELAKAGVRVELVHAEGLARGRTERAGTGEPREEELTGLFERDALVFAATKRRTTLEQQHEGLVFGRLDLDAATDDGPSREAEGDVALRVRYIGRLGVRDDEYEPLVIDWRAPAAAPFYRATPVQRHGVVRRRVLRCRGVTVVGVEDDLMVAQAPEGMVVVGDGALIAALTQSRGSTMRDIVATIQQHQDEAIRAPARGVTEITGGPGTGKTVVALHRAAYLLYADRRRFEAGGVLVVGPSAAYTAYIERVLPSLGEDSVTLRSLGDVVGGVTATRLDPPATAAVKGSLRMREVLRAAARLPVPGAPSELRCFVAGHAIRLDQRVLNRARSTVLRRHHRNGAAQVVTGVLADLAWAEVSAPSEERAEFIEAFSDSRDVEAFLQQWWRPVDPREVLRWLADEEVASRVAGSSLDRGEVSALAGSLRTAEDRGSWSVADVALLDDLAERLGPLPEGPKQEREFYEVEELDDVAQHGVAALRPERSSASSSGEQAWSSPLPQDPVARLMSGSITPPDAFAHVLLDEAQDVSPMQWRMLARRGRSASWTVVGDAAQASWGQPAEAAAAREQAFGSAPRRSFHMDTNYRNAKEVFDLAARVIRRSVPDADIPRAVRETGHHPVERDVRARELTEAVAGSLYELLSQVDGIVAVITGPRWSPVAHEAVDSLEDSRAHQRVVVLDPVASKGLEYDATLVVDPDGIVETAAGGVRALYVALTRAAHRMTVLRPV